MSTPAELPTDERNSEGLRVLVLAPDPVDADMLRGVVGDELDDASVLVVSPALNESRVGSWTSDSGEAIADARPAGVQTVVGLREEGVAAADTTGESEPLLALQDALVTFPADRIAIFVRAGDDQRYREDDVCGTAQAQFAVPVTLATL
jgi:hypothetical protein